MKGQSFKVWVSGAAVAMAMVLAAVPANAQAVTAADAKPFLGSWSLTLDTPQGAMPMDVNVKEADGTVTGEIGSDMMGLVTVTDITKTDASLVLKYTFDMQGSQVPFQITLTPDGENMKFALDAMAGQFYIEGVATRK